MVIDDALGLARGAGGIVEGDRVPFVARPQEWLPGVALGKERFVIDIADAPRLEPLIDDLDDIGAMRGHLQRSFGNARERAVDHQHPAFGVIEDVRDRRCIEAEIVGVQHRAGPRHAVMGFDHRGGIGREHRYHLAIAHADAAQSAGERPATPQYVRPAQAPIAMHDADLIRINQSRPLDKSKRREREVIRRALPQAG